MDLDGLIVAPNIELEDLRWFLALAKHKSFRRAAKHLDVSPSAITQRLNKLEGELRTKLVVRGRGRRPKADSPQFLERNVDGEENVGTVLLSGRQRDRFLLTETGREFYGRAIRILQEVREAEAAIYRTIHSRHTFLYVGHAPDHREAVLAAVMSAMRKDPNLRVRIEQGSYESIEQGVRDGRLDLGLLSYFVRRKKGLQYQYLADVPLRLVVSKAHPIAKFNAVRQVIDELAAERFVMLSTARYERTIAELYFKSQHFIPNIAVETNVLGTALALVRATSLITALPVPGPHLTELRGLALVNLPDSRERARSFLIWRDVELGPQAKATQLLQAELRAILGGGLEPPRPSGDPW